MLNFSHIDVFIIIAIVLVMYILNNTIKWESFENQCSAINGECYNVAKLDSHDDAADKLAYLTEYNKQFLRYLRRKYIWAQDYQTTNSNRFQKMRIITKNILKQYNPDVIYENHPITKDDGTSFIVNKGEKIGYCLREKQSGNHNLHDLDLMIFVNLHELSHLADLEYDTSHSPKFWHNFSLVLHEAANAGLYTPIDYSKNPTTYCGMEIEYNPYFDL